MTALIGRDYCLRHPGQVAQTFGIGVLLNMLIGRRKSLLEQVNRHNESHGIALPGTIGRAYRLASIIECRVARLYGRLAERFRDVGPVRSFYLDLQREEEEHSRLMELCRYAVCLKPGVTFAPGPCDPLVRNVRESIREIERALDSLSVEEALQKTEDLERSEVNVIFERLLKQTDAPQSRLFEQRLRELEGHGESVPRRIQGLRRKLAQARAA